MGERERERETYIAEHVKKSCFKSEPDKKSTTWTKPSSGNKFKGLLPNVQNRFLSAISLGTSLFSHLNLLQLKSNLTQGVLCSKHLWHTRVIRGSPWFCGGIFLNISNSEKSVNLRHSRHPACIRASSQSVHSRSSAPQFSSQATVPQMPQLRMRPMPLSSWMHRSHTLSCNIFMRYGAWRKRIMCEVTRPFHNTTIITTHSCNFHTNFAKYHINLQNIKLFLHG